MSLKLGPGHWMRWHNSGDPDLDAKAWYATCLCGWRSAIGPHVEVLTAKTEHEFALDAQQRAGGR